jgi:enoyl-CoA hydratase/carnithine racemase
MVFNKITLEVSDGIACVTFRNPGKLNAWDGQMLHELKSATGTIARDDHVRVAILTGEGKAFSVGADLNWFTPDVPTHQFRLQAIEAHDVFDSIENMEKPVIAAINGTCVGGGLEMALSCDLRVAADTARFGFPEVNAGIIPGSGGCSRLTRIVGVGFAKELVMTGELISAAQAKKMRLLNAVVPADQVLAKAKEFAEKMMKSGPLAVGMAKQIINTALSVDSATGRTLERLGQSVLLTTADAKEGFSAFRQKRPPKFTGR